MSEHTKDHPFYYMKISVVETKWYRDRRDVSLLKTRRTVQGIQQILPEAVDIVGYNRGRYLLVLRVRAQSRHALTRLRREDGPFQVVGTHCRFPIVTRRGFQRPALIGHRQAMQWGPNVAERLNEMFGTQLFKIQ